MMHKAMAKAMVFCSPTDVGQGYLFHFGFSEL